MIRFLTLSSLFLLIFSFQSGYAMEFKCPPAIQYTSYKCTGNTQVENLSQLNTYLASLSGDPNKLKNLVINFNLASSTNLNISTPCQITIPDNKQYTVQNLCLHGTKGVVIGNNFTITSEEFRVEAAAEITIKNYLNLNSSNAEIFANDLKGRSHVKIGNSATINSTNVQIQSTGRTTFGENANINVDEVFGIYSQGDDVAAFKSGTVLSASVIELSTFENLRIDSNVNITAANEIIINAQTVNISATGTQVILKKRPVPKPYSK